MTAPKCDQCQGPLFACDLLSNLTTCAECSRKALRASRRGTRPVAVDEWATFTAALRQASVGGVVHQSAVRPIIRGRIEPKHIGRCYSRAKREGLLVEIGHDESNDQIGKNAGRLEPRYELRSAA